MKQTKDDIVIKRQRQQCRHHHLLPSLLQKKGIIILTLLVLAESVTLANAVSFWSSSSSYTNGHQSRSYSTSNGFEKSGKTSSSSSSSRSKEQQQEEKGGGRQQQQQQQQEQVDPSSVNEYNNNFFTFVSAQQKPPVAAATVVTSSGGGSRPTRRSRLSRRMSDPYNNNNNNQNFDASQCPSSLECPPCPPHVSSSATSMSSSGSSDTTTTTTTTASLLEVRGGHLTPPSSSSETLTSTAAAAASAMTETSSTPYNIPLNMWKIIMQFFLTSINIFFWLVPLLHSDKLSENQLVLSIANSFSGGVFLSLAFGHLIPECTHGFDGSNTSIFGGEALPYMFVLSGYLLVFFVEKVAFDAHGALHEMEEGGRLENGEEEKKKKKEVVGASTVSTGRSAIVLLCALAVHSVLEMTALGLADTFGNSALLSLSIALHQPAESIALLIAFLKSGMPKPQIIRYLSVFSTCGPIGVTIGMAVQSFASPLIDSIMLAVVAGTFVYVGATEVIPEEFEDGKNKWVKFMSLISGIGVIFVITQYTMMLEEGVGQ